MAYRTVNSGLSGGGLAGGGLAGGGLAGGGLAGGGLAAPYQGSRHRVLKHLPGRRIETRAKGPAFQVQKTVTVGPAPLVSEVRNGALEVQREAAAALETIEEKKIPWLWIAGGAVALWWFLKKK